MGEDFCQNLRNARLRIGMSQKDMAKEIGVASSSYSLYESGKREPNVALIKKMAAVLKTTGDELLGIDKPQILAAHFDGSEYSIEELEEIKEFAKFVRSKRNQSHN